MAACHYDMIYDGDGVVCIQIAAVIAVVVVKIAPKKGIKYSTYMVTQFGYLNPTGN